MEMTLCSDFQMMKISASGRYGQLRVVLNGAAIQLDNGEIYATDNFDPPVILPVTGELVCPSCSTSGFKVLLQGRGLDLLDAEELLVLDALDDAERAPGDVVVDARELAGPPDQADDRERSVGLDVQGVALLVVG